MVYLYDEEGKRAGKWINIWAGSLINRRYLQHYNTNVKMLFLVEIISINS